MHYNAVTNPKTIEITSKEIYRIYYMERMTVLYAKDECHAKQ